MILVTGATGIAGSQVVRALLEQRQDVRAFVRDPDKARGLFGDAADLARRRLRRATRRCAPRSTAPTCSSSRAPTIRGGSSGRPPRSMRRPKRACAGSSSSPRSSPAGSAGRVLGLARPDRAAPERLGGPRGDPPLELLHVEPARRSRAVALDGKLYAPAGEAQIAMIDPRDVGAAAAAVLTSAGHDGRSYALTGPEAVTYTQVAQPSPMQPVARSSSSTSPTRPPRRD